MLLNSGDEMGRVQANLVNANGVLSKPISSQALRKLLTEVLPNFALGTEGLENGAKEHSA